MRPSFAAARLAERASATCAQCLGTALSATNTSASGAAPSLIADRVDGGAAPVMGTRAAGGAGRSIAGTATSTGWTSQSFGTSIPAWGACCRTGGEHPVGADPALSADG